MGRGCWASWESAATAQGITQAHLETTSFQARGFYERHGYTVFGVLEGKPVGHAWFYMKKTWVTG